MKLVTYTAGGAEPRVGAMNADDTRVVDLAAADNQPYFATMLDVIETGDEAVGRAKDIVATATDSTSLPLADVALKSPILVPPQMRDFLCFEEHLFNSFAMLRKKKADAEPDPEAALKRFEKEGAFAIPQIWYDQPPLLQAQPVRCDRHRRRHPVAVLFRDDGL